ncbi:MAG: bacteriophage holin [Candidatus Omnitrophica bacterium]|nr:bacteriophage holin [Candidatus Omnitrophota bacterium]MDD5236166.1 bacteriophage holin [Candidatus Omnitrophota bacterium]MDD5610938.1 bacteriophage holin [Candidatus Omnitrophota bacterium]
MNKLNVRALGLALGIVWSMCIFLLGIFAMSWGWGMKWLESISSFYIGYKATFLGSIIGAIWAFFDAGIGGVLIAWLYNKLNKQ